MPCSRVFAIRLISLSNIKMLTFFLVEYEKVNRLEIEISIFDLHRKSKLRLIEFYKNLDYYCMRCVHFSPFTHG